MARSLFIKVFFSMLLAVSLGCGPSEEQKKVFLGLEKSVADYKRDVERIVKNMTDMRDMASAVIKKHKEASSRYKASADIKLAYEELKKSLESMDSLPRPNLDMVEQTLNKYKSAMGSVEEMHNETRRINLIANEYRVLADKAKESVHSVLKKINVLHRNEGTK